MLIFNFESAARLAATGIAPRDFDGRRFRDYFYFVDHSEGSSSPAMTLKIVAR
jgi:hypothetical protein